MARRPPVDLVVSDRAATYMELLPEFELDQLRLIERALLADLARPTPAELREARLGLLMDMVMDGNGVVPNADDYDLLRAERAKLGEEWPHSTTLLRAYSHSWNIAVRAAMRLLFDGPAGVAVTHAKRGLVDDYAREEVKVAIRRFRDEHEGRWPRAQQFYDWGDYLRMFALLGGHPDPRVPSPGPVIRHFGNFRTALAAAKRGT